MHEWTLAADMLKLVEKALGGKRRLVSATLTLGPLSGVSAEALCFAFPEIARQEGFGEPRLLIRQAQARLRCRGCGAEYVVEDFHASCPACRSFDRTILGGREFILESVEVEEDDHAPT
ncbi:MAG: hydrogenase maturation nickel metallochaperone HypA [Planctomycetota bacterium]